MYERTHIGMYTCMNEHTWVCMGIRDEYLLISLAIQIEYGDFGQVFVYTCNNEYVYTCILSRAGLTA